MLRVYSILILLLIAGSINAQSSNQADSIDFAVDSIDNRPLLKRWFKDFPVVYSDTAYSATNYVIVFKATLMNHSWHHHSRENMKRQRVYAIPDSASEDNQSNSFVKFISTKHD
ncbi:MAG: hypothetical protein K2N79_06660 [Muribaculaceae bacterium]|nr:hypothetical protein [Muribaculaceae bacterium]MDE7368465.1 hypothetical protein [Muribaculaceae bacterium]